MVKIKVCGMTRQEDVIKAAELGADAVGFILCSSKRQVKLDGVSEMTKSLPPFISVVAVVSDPTEQELYNIISSNLFTCIQFHGDENPEKISKIPLRKIKAVRVSRAEDLKIAKEYEDVVSAILFDTKVDGKRGGTGKSFDWHLLKYYKGKVPYIVAGGIGYKNIGKLLKVVLPYGVDINSSVESSPGIKDHILMEKTIKEIRRYTT